MKENLAKVKQIFISPSLSSLWRWSKGHRKSLFILSFGQVLMAALGLVFTLVMKDLIDAAVATDMESVKRYAFLLAFVIVLQLLSSFIFRYYNSRVTVVFRQKMRTMMIGRILGKKYSEIADIHSGLLTGRILTDTNTVTSAIVSIVPSLLYLLTQFVGAAVILFTFNHVFVLSLIGICLLGAVFMALMGNRMKKYFKTSRDREDVVLASVTESMQNIRIIKASRIEEETRQKIWGNQENFVRAELKKSKFSTAANTGVNFIFRFTWLYAMIWGCLSIVNGVMSYGMLTAMLQLVAQVQGPISSLSGIVAQMYGAVSSAERMDELLAKEDEAGMADEDKSAATAQEMYASLKEIDVEGLHFTYDREEVIKGASFKIKPGDITAITGHSGCGKSTFFLLLMGLYEPDIGNIEFKFSKDFKTTAEASSETVSNDSASSKKTADGDISFEEVHNEDYSLPASRTTRRMFSYVPQGNALFSGTIRDNVSLFRKDATEDEIWAALKTACIDDFVNSLETGLDTVLGEKGVGLSEGQGQRIAIARAVLSDAPIILFDEATSALDEETEAKVLENIAEFKNRTCLIVTHRPAALKICNEHYCFEDPV